MRIYDLFEKNDKKFSVEKPNERRSQTRLRTRPDDVQRGAAASLRSAPPGYARSDEG